MQTSMIYYLVFLFTVGCSQGSTPPNATSTEARQSAAAFLDPAEQQKLRTLVDSGRLAELQWQNFSDYVISVKEFYATEPVQLAWTSEGKPTRQTLELIAILEEAG